MAVRILKDIALARTARQLAAASHPAQFPSGAVGAVSKMLDRTCLALDVGLSDDSHPLALAIAQVVGHYRGRLLDILARAYGIEHPPQAPVGAPPS